jgi:hypothetical protein
MSFHQPVAFSPLFLEYFNFPVFSLLGDGGDDFCTINYRFPNGDRISVSDQQDRIEFNTVPNIAFQLFNHQLVANCHLVLLTTRFYDRVHYLKPHKKYSRSRCYYIVKTITDKHTTDIEFMSRLSARHDNDMIQARAQKDVSVTELRRQEAGTVSKSGAGGVKRFLLNLESSSFAISANSAGPLEGSLLTMLFDGHGGFPLLTMGSDPTHFVTVQFIVEPHTNNTGPGIAHRHHVLIGPYLAKFTLGLVTPGNSGEQT